MGIGVEMRDIKVRAWDTQLETYSYSGWGEKTFAIFAKRTNCERYIIEQYIGYKHWFENDIIRTGHFIDNNGKQQYLYHQIVWSEKYFGWFAKNCGNDGSFNEKDNGNIQLWVFVKDGNREIIGTIHDMPKA